MLLLLIPLSLAQESSEQTSYTFKQGSEVNFQWKCFDENNNYCSSSTTLTISITGPNGTNIIDNSSMTHNPTYYNYSLPTSDLGTYKALINSYNGNATSSFTYTITPTGFAHSTSQGINSSIILIVVFGLGVVSLLFGFKLFDIEGHYWMLGLIIIGFGVGMLIYTISLTYLQAQNIAYGIGADSVQSGIFLTGMRFLRILALLIIPFTLFMVWKAWRDSKKEKEDDDGWDYDRY